LLKWTNGLFGGKIIGPASMNIAFEAHSRSATNATRGYGYGFRLEFSNPFSRIVYHTGLWGGYKTILLHRPCDNTTVVMLNNLKSADINLAWRIMGTMNDDGDVEYEEEEVSGDI
jgi:CubicO group peptidase (beta-lactamase class C family)